MLQPDALCSVGGGGGAGAGGSQSTIRAAHFERDSGLGADSIDVGDVSVDIDGRGEPAECSRINSFIRWQTTKTRRAVTLL